MNRKLVIILLVSLTFAGAFAAGSTSAETGMKKRRPLPFEYGRVVINNYSQKAGLAPVVFNHWLHRSNYTCRLCHVDIGFAMKAGETGIKASDNIRGYYCGTCHNGRRVADNKKTIFASCSVAPTPAERTRCLRCHSLGMNVTPEYDFSKFTRDFPKERFGNGINWEKTEEEGLIRPADFLEGVSIKRKSLAVQKDFSLSPKLEGMPNIIFSHKKHTVWNGCELCHPEIFIGVKKGKTKYSMPEIFEGKYCGVCHTSVAFPLIDCQRCHTQPVQ
jgi:c(7)-type cytochrome triheme protein